jgi:hypothetical protein
MSIQTLDSSTWHQEFTPYVDGVRVRWEDLRLNILVGKVCELKLDYEYSWLIGNPDASICLEHQSGAGIGSVKFDPLLGHLRELIADPPHLTWSISTELADIGPFVLQFAIPPMEGMPKSPSVTIDTPDSALEVEVLFDSFPVAFKPGFPGFPCHGAVHTISMRRHPSSSLRDREVRLLWEGASAESLGMVITPSLDSTWLLTKDWQTWNLDCTDSIKDGYFALRVQAVVSGETTEALSMGLGHNLVTVTRWFTGPHDSGSNQAHYLRFIQATSAFTNKRASNVSVMVNGLAHPVKTNWDGIVQEKETVGNPKSFTILNQYDGSVV